MKVKVFVGLVALIMSGRILISYIQERAGESFENDRPCESLRLFEITALVSKSSKQIAALIHAGGLCGQQDIPRAVGYYSDYFGEDNIAIGKALFYDAIETSDSDERRGRPRRPIDLLALLNKSKELGFEPLEKDLFELRRRNIDLGPFAGNARQDTPSKATH